MWQPTNCLKWGLTSVTEDSSGGTSMSPASDAVWSHDGTVTSPQGFRAGAAACGLKPDGQLDVALLVSDPASRAAAVFTRNRVVAAPVTVDRESLQKHGGSIRAVVANAGNANACTGPKGLAAARRTQEMVAAKLEVEAGQVLVLSTGVIGVPLPMKKIGRGIDEAYGRLSPDEGSAAARAIMTTDTRPKHRSVRLGLSGGEVRLGGIAKGAGMIHPDMATMLGVVTTDASVGRAQLQHALQRSVDRSFNCISVDGDTSTNDAVLLLANGAEGVEVTAEDLPVFEAALTELCVWLARAIVMDAEGATKFVTLHVTGATDTDQARVVARTVASSPLVKTALHGGDPNWGRILAAAGRSGAPLEAERLSLSVRTEGRPYLQLVEGGAPSEYEENEAVEVFNQPEFELQLDLGIGASQATVWTCDLSHEYVTINSHYRT